MKKILITGSTGMLGSDLVRTFKQFSEYEVFGLSRTKSALLPEANQFMIDLAEPFSASSISIEPDVIIHTAAITDLGLCERDPQLADRVHVQASMELAKLAGSNTKFIYISTDSIFNGQKGKYTEDDTPDPLNQYALTKLKGEQAVREHNKGITQIIRTNIYGFHVPLKNSLAEWAFSEWQKGKSIFGFTDIVFNAVFTNQLVLIIRFLIETQLAFSILNVGSKTPISKYEFLDKFRKSLGIPDGLLKAAESTTFPSSIQRPRDTSLDTSRLETFYAVPDFDSGFADWLKQAKQYGVL